MSITSLADSDPPLQEISKLNTSLALFGLNVYSSVPLQLSSPPGVSKISFESSTLPPESFKKNLAVCNHSSPVSIYSQLTLILYVRPRTYLALNDFASATQVIPPVSSTINSPASSISTDLTPIESVCSLSALTAGTRNIPTRRSPAKTASALLLFLSIFLTFLLPKARHRNGYQG